MPATTAGSTSRQPWQASSARSSVSPGWMLAASSTSMPARRIVARGVGEEHEHDAVRDAEPLDVAAEGVDEFAIARLVAPRPEELQPVGVDPQCPEPQEVLQRNPEIAAARGILGDEGRADEDGNSHGAAVRHRS